MSEQSSSAKIIPVVFTVVGLCLLALSGALFVHWAWPDSLLISVLWGGLAVFLATFGAWLVQAGMGFKPNHAEVRD